MAYIKNSIYLLITVWIIGFVVGNTNTVALPSIEHNGDTYWRKGDIVKAVSVWKKEASIYRERQNKNKEIQTLLKIANVHISLGQFDSAITELNKAIDIDSLDTHTKALTYKRLGNAYSGLGKYNKAISNYEKSWKIDDSLHTLNNLVEALIDRSQYYQFIGESASNAIAYKKQKQEDRDAAVGYAKLALSMSNKDLASVRALINWTNISPESLTQEQLNKSKEILNNLVPSRNLAFTMINWAKIDKEGKESWLQQSLNVANTLNDDYLKSYVFLELGYYEEQFGNLTQAYNYARQAQLKAQSEFAYDSLFRAQQLAARIHQARGEKTAAIDAYTQAIASLDLLRQDSLIISLDRRVNFEAEIESIYRSALKLLLDSNRIEKANLLKAMAINDKLRLAQLQNYFGDDCFEIIQENLDRGSLLRKNTAVINSIILKDKTHFILELPDGRLIHSQADIPKTELIELANQWNSHLTNRATNEYREGSMVFYDLIIKPFEEELIKNNTEVITFVHDGILRNLPMAALYDGEEFLAQKWASVSSIGLNFDSAALDTEKTQVAAFGLQSAIADWSSLPYVASEIKVVQNILGGDRFLNREFTLDNLSNQLIKEEYGTVHFATHGYFGGTAETSFILAYDQQISILELENVLSKSKQTPNLLVLSACETALSSDRSLLGLAGVAARSGVNSTIGTLWQVLDDEQSEMIEDFYTYWQSSKYNKAKALQLVQISEIERYDNSHPEKWASLALIGDGN